MHISITAREEACLQFIRGGFDQEKTIEWFLNRNSDHPVVLRAKNQEALARNIITMGSTGLQQEANIKAFQGAMTQFAEEQRRREVNVIKTENERLQQQLDTERNKVAGLEREYREQVEKLQGLSDKLNQAETTVLRMQLPVGETAAAEEEESAVPA